MQQIRRGSGTVPIEINPSASESRKSMTNDTIFDPGSIKAEDLVGVPVTIEVNGIKKQIGQIDSARVDTEGVYASFTVDVARDIRFDLPITFKAKIA